MLSRFSPFLLTIALLGVSAVAFSLIPERIPLDDATPLPAAAVVATETQEEIPEEAAAEPDTDTEPSEEIIVAEPSPEQNEAVRIEAPYSFPPESPEALDAKARGAVVNIFCRSRDPQLLSSSGSGVIIDQKGIVLTNAHLAQYFLLDERTDIDVSCSIRAGSPVRPAYRASILFIPENWVRTHASDIIARQSTGTGERDFALLRIKEHIDGSPLPSQFPFLPPDEREAIGFSGDTVLLAGYPAEFISGSAAVSGLSITTSFATIGDLLTFTKDLVDVVSLGSTPLAQGGASGGAVVNMHGRVIGIVTTTSSGDTTAERDLRAITLAHIDRSLSKLSGLSLSAFLSQDMEAVASAFKAEKAPELSRILIEALRNR